MAVCMSMGSSRVQAAALQGLVVVLREGREMGPVKVSQEFQLQELCSKTESYIVAV